LEILTEGELRAIKTLAESEMSPEDEEAFNKMFSSGFSLSFDKDVAASSSSASGGAAPLTDGFVGVKIEKVPEKLPSEIMAEKIAWLKGDIEGQHKKYLEMNARCESLVTQVEAKANKNEREAKYMGPLRGDLTAILLKLPKLTKLLKHMITNETEDESPEFVKVIKIKEVIDELMQDIEHAVPKSNLEAVKKVRRQQAKRKRKDSSSSD
jgi:hypothetical protein